MGEHYKSRPQALAMLKRSMGEAPMASKQLKESTIVPTNSPHSKTLKKKSSKKKSKMKSKSIRQTKPEHSNNDAVLRPKGWKAPMFMLPVKSSGPGNNSAASPFSQRNKDVMTPRSKRYVNSLGGQGLLKATERALRRSVPHHLARSLIAIITVGMPR